MSFIATRYFYERGEIEEAYILLDYTGKADYMHRRFRIPRAISLLRAILSNRPIVSPFFSFFLLPPPPILYLVFILVHNWFPSPACRTSSEFFKMQPSGSDADSTDAISVQSIPSSFPSLAQPPSWRSPFPLASHHPFSFFFFFFLSNHPLEQTPFRATFVNNANDKFALQLHRRDRKKKTLCDQELYLWLWYVNLLLYQNVNNNFGWINCGSMNDVTTYIICIRIVENNETLLKIANRFFFLKLQYLLSQVL